MWGFYGSVYYSLRMKKLEEAREVRKAYGMASIEDVFDVM